ncbi:MAG: hypothetical protein A2Y25_10710 [Candidatus Melainabacteria bacterium GWF2_37_15]|nr:MAG: hypothetical protein A2Y25_10710 [Candidatus Melainabacteria bacterium GWF2_37_15]
MINSLSFTGVYNYGKPGARVADHSRDNIPALEKALKKFETLDVGRKKFKDYSASITCDMDKKVSHVILPELNIKAERSKDVPILDAVVITDNKGNTHTIRRIEAMRGYAKDTTLFDNVIDWVEVLAEEIAEDKIILN